MTGVFFFGLLAVFLPLGLGMGFLGQLFKAYHGPIYLVAGIFFLLLGLFILSGIHFSLPFKTRLQVKVTGALSVFVLGIFSGFATLCCAPVLAGAIALSALPGSILWGGLYSVIYVMGMVIPLFIISYFLDKKGVMDKVNFFKKEFTYSMFKRKISLTVSNIFSGVVFIIMGGIILYYDLTYQITMNPSESQLRINIILSKLTEIITQFLNTVFGQVIFFVGIITILFFLTRAALKKHSRKDK